jgi:ParB family transcriptional regulator, chromosome partitioning protein
MSLPTNKRKKFTISDDINRGITEVINAVNNNVGSFRYEVVALSRIEIDPNNPREIALTDKDITSGIDVGDVQAIKKKKEKEDLESLAHTIKHNGIINPIVIYKHEDRYRIVAGERRFLATYLAGKSDVHARIVDKKPDEVNLRLLQWIENNERKDLSLNERLKNLEAIIEAYNKKQNQEPITGDILKKLTGLSKTQAHYYLSVLKGPSDLRKSIENSVVNNLDRAALIAGIVDQDLRGKVLLACASGRSIKEIKEMIAEGKSWSKNDPTRVQTKKSGRIAQYVNLGRTKNINAIKKIIKIVTSNPNYNKHADQFRSINWNDYKNISIAFQALLTILSDGCK